MFVTEWLIPKSVSQKKESASSELYFSNISILTRGLEPKFPYNANNQSSAAPEEDYAYGHSYTTFDGVVIPYIYDVRSVNRGKLGEQNSLSSPKQLSDNRGHIGNSLTSALSFEDSNDFNMVRAVDGEGFGSASWNMTENGNTALVVYKPSPVSFPIAIELLRQGGFVAESGEKYRAEVWVSSLNAESTFRIYDTAGNQFDSGYTFKLPNLAWTKLSVDFVGAGKQVSLVVATNDGDDGFFVDNAVVTRPGIAVVDVPILDKTEDIIRYDYGIATAFNMKRNNVDEITEYLVLTALHPDIPEGAVVKKAQLSVQMAHHNMFQPPSYPTLFGLYNIKVRYVFDHKLVLDGCGSSAGYMSITNQQVPKINMKRNYQYMSYENGKFVGEWTDVTSEPDTLLAVNAFPGEMTVSLARTPFSSKADNDDWQVVADVTPEAFEIDTHETMLLSTESKQLFGSGSDINLNNDVDIVEYYGGYENLVFHDGEDFITDELQPLQTTVGHPMGRMHFRGYISKYKKKFRNPREGIDVTLLSHADEYNNIVYESVDTLVKGNKPTTKKLAELGYYADSVFENVLHSVAQTFKVTGVTNLASIKIFSSSSSSSSSSTHPTLYLTLVKGSVDGEVIANSKTTVPPEAGWVNFALGVKLEPNVSYTFILRTDWAVSGYSPAPVVLYAGEGYGDGAFYTRNVDRLKNAGDWQLKSNYDLTFELYRRGGETSVLEASQDPTTMAKHVIDYGVSRGSQLRYTKNSLTPSNTKVTARFNVVTLKEAFDNILKYLPTDWLWYFDQAEMVLYVRPRPSTTTHIFELGNDIEYFEPEYSIENIVNEVYFTGGKKPDETTLFRHYVDLHSQSKYRKGLAKKSNQNITTDLSADIIVGSLLARGANPTVAGEISIIRDKHPEVVMPGELVGFAGFPDDINNLQLQVLQVKITRHRYIIQLGTLLPKTSKRLEDLKRNLETMETMNNPNAPS